MSQTQNRYGHEGRLDYVRQHEAAYPAATRALPFAFTIKRIQRPYKNQMNPNDELPKIS